LGRLSLVIADYDAEYLQNFEKYLITYHPKRFEMTSFSAAEPLNEYLRGPHKTDILLVSSKMYKEITDTGKQEIVLILSENGSPAQPGPEAVDKYQHMDRLISEVLRLYSLGSRKECTVSGNKGTRIISVVSPAGGTGKSSIAAGCSILCAGRGMKAFYLNLEEIPSTEIFFHGDSKQNFSNVIYHLKGSSPNLWLKLEAAACADAGTGVHFFRSAANILDMNELTEEDLSRLLFEFRKSSAYNAVFIDLPTGLNTRNSSVLKYSDEILMILTPDFKLEGNIDKFSKALEMFEERLNLNLTCKLLTVMNFSTKKNVRFLNYKPIAEISDHSVNPGTKAFIKPVENPAFLAELNKVVNHILPVRRTETSSSGGWPTAMWDRAAVPGRAEALSDMAAVPERPAVSWDGAVMPETTAAKRDDAALPGAAAVLGRDAGAVWDGGEFIV
jgi:MinD-like ATPase involved in chromosome partitioning or flagellar assembly